MQKKTIFILCIMISLMFMGCNLNKEKDANNKVISKKEMNAAFNFSVPEFDNNTTSNDLKTKVEGIIAKIDANLGQVKKIDKKVSFEIFTDYGIITQKSPVTVWHLNNKPVKIIRGVADDSGEITGSFAYYFHNGRIWYSDQGVKYVFHDFTDFYDHRLQFWLDEEWNKITDIPKENFLAREQLIINDVNLMVKDLIHNNDKNYWYVDYNTSDREVLRKGVYIDSVSKNPSTLIDILNRRQSIPKIELVKVSGNTIYLKLSNEMHFTESMGTLGADAYLAETVYTLTEIDNIEKVNLDIEAGSHGSPGTYDRKYVENIIDVSN